MQICRSWGRISTKPAPKIGGQASRPASPYIAAPCLIYADRSLHSKLAFKLHLFKGTSGSSSVATRLLAARCIYLRTAAPALFFSIYIYFHNFLLADNSPPPTQRFLPRPFQNARFETLERGTWEPYDEVFSKVTSVAVVCKCFFLVYIRIAVSIAISILSYFFLHNNRVLKFALMKSQMELGHDFLQLISDRQQLITKLTV